MFMVLDCDDLARILYPIYGTESREEMYWKLNQQFEFWLACEFGGGELEL